MQVRRTRERVRLIVDECGLPHHHYRVRATQGDDGRMSSDESTVLGRLLEELSWEGHERIKSAYRAGGRGQENVLAAEVLMPLDFLPRTSFLGEVLSAAHGADRARAAAAADVEQLRLSFLDQLYVPSRSTPNKHAFEVQPDAQLISDQSYVLVEAKRIRQAQFQAQQLSREYVTVLHHAADRVPLLLLILGSEPPVKVDKHGRLDIGDAIRLYLEEIHAQVDSDLTLEELYERVDETWAWITWSEVAAIVAQQAEGFHNSDTSVDGCVRRLSAAVGRAIAWHS